MNTLKAARHAARLTGKLLVKFPHNDYLIAGRVACCEPSKNCKLHEVDGAPFVRFDGREWLVDVEVYQFRNRNGQKCRHSDGRLCRARLFFTAVKLVP